MSGSVNRVILVARLGKDPVITYTQGGTAIANFSVATSESFKGKDGVKQDKTEWVKIVVFGKLAEICGEYLTKGKQVYLEGRLQTSQWDDKEGNKRYTTEVIVNNMQMLGGRGESQPQASGTDTVPDIKDNTPPF